MTLTIFLPALPLIQRKRQLLIRRRFALSLTEGSAHRTAGRNRCARVSGFVFLLRLRAHSMFLRLLFAHWFCLSEMRITIDGRRAGGHRRALILFARQTESKPVACAAGWLLSSPGSLCPFAYDPSFVDLYLTYSLPFTRRAGLPYPAV